MYTHILQMVLCENFTFMHVLDMGSGVTGTDANRVNDWLHCLVTCDCLTYADVFRLAVRCVTCSLN